MLVESVGIGQSEADISFVADTVLLCVQPGSGDSLQFMKAGVTELPDVVAVTKADMVEAARRTRADVEGALTLYSEQRRAPVVLVAASRDDGLDELDAALADHRAWLTEDERLARKRHAQQELVDRAGDPRAFRLRRIERDAQDAAASWRAIHARARNLNRTVNASRRVKIFSAHCSARAINAISRLMPQKG